MFICARSNGYKKTARKMNGESTLIIQSRRVCVTRMSTLENLGLNNCLPVFAD